MFHNITCWVGQAAPKICVPQRHFHLPCHSVKQRLVTLQGLCYSACPIAIFCRFTCNLRWGKWSCCTLHIIHSFIFHIILISPGKIPRISKKVSTGRGWVMLEFLYRLFVDWPQDKNLKGSGSILSFFTLFFIFRAERIFRGCSLWAWATPEWGWWGESGAWLTINSSS